MRLLLSALPALSLLLATGISVLASPSARDGVREPPPIASDEGSGAAHDGAPAASRGARDFGLGAPAHATGRDLVIGAGAGLVGRASTLGDGLPSKPVAGLLDAGVSLDVRGDRHPDGGIHAPAVPEPGTSALLAGGLLVLALRGRRR